MTLRPANSSLINRRNYAENRHGSASMRRSTTIDVQHAHFYGFKGEAQYLHRHTGVLTIEVADTMNDGATETYEPCKTKSTALQARDFFTLWRSPCEEKTAR